MRKKFEFGSYFCGFCPTIQKFLSQINQKIAHAQKCIPHFFSFSHTQKFITQSNGAISLFCTNMEDMGESQENKVENSNKF